MIYVNSCYINRYFILIIVTTFDWVNEIETLRCLFNFNELLSVCYCLLSAVRYIFWYFKTYLLL